MNNNAVVTIAYGKDFSELGEVTHPTIKSYADKIGADFIVLNELGNHKYPHYIKFDLKELLSKYDRVLYVDTDIVIRDDAPNIFDVVPENKLGILKEYPCTTRDPAFQRFINELGCQKEWNKKYYNTGVMVLNKNCSDLFNLKTEEIIHYGEQSYINYNIIESGIEIHELDWRFNRMGAHDSEIDEWRFSAYFMHYASYLAPPNTAELIKNLIKKDLDVWEKHKPEYKFPKNKFKKTNFHMEYKEDIMQLSEIKFKDRVIYFRDGTSDAVILNANFNVTNMSDWKPEYIFPIFPEEPKVIFDIGANIGITALLLNARYPNATIYSFEPESDNFKILQKNVDGIDNIKTFNFGLSDKNIIVYLKKSEQESNFGGFTIFDKGASGDHQEITLRSIDLFMKENEIEKIDMIKIDCEGAEHDILTSINLKDVSWIEGECHGIKDHELLGYVSNTHILGIAKPLFQRNFNFHALNKKHTTDKFY